MYLISIVYVAHDQTEAPAGLQSIYSRRSDNAFTRILWAPSLFGNDLDFETSDAAYGLVVNTGILCYRFENDTP